MVQNRSVSGFNADSAFVNGLAMVIAMAQFGHFKVAGADGALQWMSGAALYTMFGLTVLTMAIIYILPKLTSAVPSSLVSFGKI